MTDRETFNIWPSAPPGTEDWSREEVEYFTPFPDEPTRQWRGIRNVVTPTLTVYRPATPRPDGPAVVVCPGGGFHLLAYDYEGTDVAEWFAARGVTAFLLKYRVEPTPAAPADFEAFGAQLAITAFTDLDAWIKTLDGPRMRAIADGRQALKLIREKARDYDIDPAKIGFIGFSAGAGLTLGVALSEPAERPNFAIPIYGGDRGDEPVEGALPPLFLVVSENDPFRLAPDNLRIYQRWVAAGGAADLHIFAEGGHGYGMRQLGMTTDQWPSLLERWLKKLKIFEDA